MVIADISEYVEVDLKKWNEGIVAAKDVQAIGKIRMAHLFKLVSDIIKAAGECCEHIMPQSLDSVLRKCGV